MNHPGLLSVVSIATAVIGLFAAQCGADQCAGDDTRVTKAPVPAGGQAVAAKTDAKGTIHLMLDSSDGPQYVASDDNARTWSTPIAVVDKSSRKPGLEFNAWDMAVSADG